MRIDVPAEILPAAALGRVHLVGVGGAGLSAIARLMLAAGVEVSGSDAKDSDVLRALSAEGVRTSVGHDASNLEGVDTVVASTAVRDDNPEIVAAVERGLRLWPRSAGVQSFLLGRHAVAVAGTHGKTTTTAMLTVALQEAGVDPTFMIGAEVASLGTNAAAGSSDVVVVESDESDGAFLVYTPATAVVTNVDPDHLDHYGTDEAYHAAFARFVAEPATVVLCADDPGARALAGAVGGEVVLAGFHDAADVRGRDLDVSAEGTTFTVEHAGGSTPVALAVSGEHYAVDALLAFAAGLSLGAEPSALAAGLARHRGAKRRMEHVGDAGGVRVYDSYAHHPTEIRGDLAAARAIAGDARLVVAYQPHLVSRTRLHGAAMGRELAAADLVWVADLYLAREDPDPAVTSALVADAAGSDHVRVGGSLDDVVEAALGALRPGDLFLTLGAGDVTTVAPRVLAGLDDRVG